MSKRYILKLNLLVLFVEFYAIAVLLFEFGVPGTSYLQENIIAKLLFSLLPLTLTIISKYTEGWTTITLPTLVCSLFIPIAAIIPGLLKLSFAGLAILLAIVHANAILHFPVMTLIQPTGKFSVGYKSHTGNDDFRYCVFYPTLKPTKKSPKLMPDSLSFKKSHEISQGRTGNFPPKGLFEVVSHIYTKVSLYAGIDSPIPCKEELKANTNKEKMIPVVFSHGLGAAKHNYASIATQLASRGFFVICLDHMDEVKVIFQGTMEHAQKYLENRMNEVRRIIKELSTASGSIRELFGSDLNLDMSRLTMMGHSYGGATAYLTAWEDERVKNLVMLDPWLCPIQKESLDKQLNCNILLFESSDWSDTYPEAGIGARNIQVVEAQRGGRAGVIYCKVAESQHNHFSDDFLVVGGLFERLKVIKSAKTAKEVYQATINAIDDYFQLVVSKNQGEEELKKFMHLYYGDRRFPLVRYC